MGNSEEQLSFSRRHAVSALGGVGLAAGFLSAPRGAMAYGGGTEITGVFDVTKPPFNAPPTGTSDAQPAIQAAINAAQANGGGIVWLPPGVYKLNSGLVISQQVTLCGAGWSNPHPDNLGTPNNSTGNGSWISISSTSFTPITITGVGAIVRDIAFIHQQATSIASTWVPVNYPYTIEANAPDILLQNLFLRNATRGISVRGYGGRSVGRVTLDRIWGQPIIEGIVVDNALDIVYIHDVHFWGFWSYYQTVVDFMRTGDCRAITFKRADAPIISNVFAINYRRGLYFTQSQSPGVIGGITTAFMMMNIATDFCGTGIEIDGPGTTGAVSNYYSLGGPNGISGVFVNAPGVVLQCSNMRLRIYGTNCVRATGQGTIVTLESTWCDGWNQVGASYSFTAIDSTVGAKVYVGKSTIFTNGLGPELGGPASGSTGTFVVDS